ncbi:MAG TPA: hypothetical protein VK985_15645, partial [Rariglobus sp.]|nr:hypothetical protein [Rariglobus sp.]
DTVTFTGTINGGATTVGGLEIGSSPIFQGFIGDSTPISYLILNSANTVFDTTTQSTGLPTPGLPGNPATVNLFGSFINNGTITLAGNASNYTFIVDSGSDALNGSIFQGGTILGHTSNTVNGNTITIFGGAFGSVTFDNIQLGFTQYSSYGYNPAFAFTNVGAPFIPGTIYFKGPNPFNYEGERERLEREAEEKASSLAYDGSVIPEGLLALAGKLAEAPGTAGGLATSTFDIVPAGQIETFSQTVFSNTIILP